MLGESADDGNDSQRETYSSMMPLPRLKVLQDTYCSQQVVDTAVGLVETHRPELIEKLMEEEHWRQQAYSERAWDVIEYLTEEKVEVLTSLIGRMDLINDSLALSAAPMAGRRFHQKGRQWLQLRISRCRRS
jgi:hypothetical protein